MEVSLMDALVLASTIVASLITFATGYEKLILKPKEKKREERREKAIKRREKERLHLVEIRKQEYEVLMKTIESSFRPHLDRLERTKNRVNNLEEVTNDHEKRLYVIERETGIKTYRFIEDVEEENN